MLKNRMLATREASELEVGNAVYETLFQTPPEASKTKLCRLPINKLRSFFTADIGFRPYSSAKLNALAEHMAAEGQLERIIVRAIPHCDEFEILSGHNRTNAARLNNWAEIEAEIVEADDERATTIAIATNLLRRQDLTIIERGKAYKALLEAQRRQGLRTDILTSGEIRQKYSARQIVAEFFGVTEYEIRKAIKMTQLIPDLQQILEEQPRLLPLSCAEKIAEYDASSQQAFTDMCTIEGYQLNIATVNYIVQKCPPPCADRQAVYAAWREARADEDRRRMAPPKEIKFNRKRFAPYLEKLGSDAKLEELFLEFLRERVK